MFRRIVTACEILLLAGAALAQVDRSSLAGTVLDSSQRVVPGALVVATNGSGEERQTKSTSKGVYELPDLAIGSWTVVFSAPGFRNVRYEGLDLTVGRTTTPRPRCFFHATSASA